MAPTGVQTVLAAVKKGLPDVVTKRKFSFITIHYLYIGGMALFWSGTFYAIGGVDYIDSLFFTSGAATQSGLNTIDVNKITTAQQVILYMLAMLCNPIAIHSSLVFVRLYWFEKRFKDVVREAKNLRRTRSRSKQRRGSMTSDDMEARADFSIRGRAIHLLRNTGHLAEGKPIQRRNVVADEKEKNIDSSDTSGHDGSEHQLQRRSSSPSLRLPQQMNTEQHIQFLENQRNPKDDTALHIPSPREFDQGGRVTNVAEDAEDPSPQLSRLQQIASSPENSGAPPRVGTHITFNEPDVPTHHRNPTRAATAFPRIETGKASTMDPTSYDEEHSGSQNRTGTGFRRTNTVKTLEATPYLSWQPTVGRNSFFVNLTEEQREELGGIEYRALKTLALILLCYFFLFHLFGIVCLTPWIYRTSYGSVVTEYGQGRAWWGVFTSASSFNDLGFTLTPDSMISFQSATWPLLLMTFLIIIGNTGFPIMLRFIIWTTSKLVPVGSGVWEELRFLLDHPRRCFTLLFPRAATWWLFFILIILNGIDLFFFVVLDLHDEAVESLSAWSKFLVGLFQAASTRTAGFAAVNLAALHPAVQVSYMIMMYISVLPIAISMRRTNVYEEKSLGIYAGGNDEEVDDNKEPSYVGAHLRKQLSFDLWYVFLGLFIICIVEGARLENTNEYAFTVFSVLFEIVSAYGTVGLSLGYPTVNASFSSQFKIISKLVIIAMQIRGRHRGLPYQLDRAVLLPSESLHRKEAQESERILQRRQSGLSHMDLQAARSRQTDLASATSYRSHDDTNEHDLEPHNGPRQRRFTDRSTASSNGSHKETHKPGLFSRGLGTAMFKVTDAEDVIKEETEHVTSRSS